MNYDKIKKSLESYVLKISNGIFDFVVVDLSYHNCCGCGNTHTGFKIEVVVNFSKISSDIDYYSYENYFEDLFYKDIVTFFKMLNPNSKFAEFRRNFAKFCRNVAVRFLLTKDLFVFFQNSKT